MPCILSTTLMHYAVSVSTNRWAGARCLGRHDLPWTSDDTPGAAARREMAALCSDCPRLTDCALAALGTKGGFYAGVWIPWDKSTSPAMIENRRAARAALRQKARDLMVNA